MVFIEDYKSITSYYLLIHNRIPIKKLSSLQKDKIIMKEFKKMIKSH